MCVKAHSLRELKEASDSEIVDTLWVVSSCWRRPMNVAQLRWLRLTLIYVQRPVHCK